MRLSSADTPPTLRSLRKEIARAQGPLYRIAALAREHQLMDDDELREFGRLNKSGDERKVFSVDQANAMLAKFKARETSLLARLADRGIDLPTETAAPPNPPMPKRRRRTLGEQRVEDLADFTQRHIVVGAMAGGSSAREALQRASIPVTKASRRWAQRLYQQQRISGDLNDQRRVRNGAKVTVLRPEMCSLLETLWMTHVGIGASGLRQMLERHVANLKERLLAADSTANGCLLADDVRAGQVMLPCCETIRRFVRSLGPWKDHVRKFGWSEHTRQKRPTALMLWTSYANEEWQADHTPLDLWVKVEENGVWQAVQLYLTAIIDTFSAGVMGAVVSTRYPDSFTIAHCLRMAILPKDHPGWISCGPSEQLTLDNGKDFRSAHVSAFAAGLDIRLEFCAPRRPDEKPQVERFFSTITKQFLPQMPGYKHNSSRGTPWSASRVGELLTVPQARREILRWIQEEYHSTRHGGARQTPMELWANTAVRRAVPPKRDLDILLLYEARRQVTRGVVRLTLPGMARGVYWGPALTARNGHRLKLKYNPDDLASVYAYDEDTGVFVDELWDIRDKRSPYADRDVRTAWWQLRKSEQERIAGLAERLPKYFAESVKQDRVQKRRSGEDMAEARAEAAQIAAQSTSSTAADAVAVQTQEDIKAYVDRMSQQSTAESQRAQAGACPRPTRSTTPVSLTV